MTGQPRRALSERAARAATTNTVAIPLLTIDRAIADGVSPLQLRQVAEHNLKAGGRRRVRQAENLIKIAERLELLGYRSAA